MASEDKKINKPIWYKTWWGICSIVLFFPFFGIWYIWAKTKWNKNTKIITTALLSIFLLVALISVAKEMTQTVTTQQETPKQNSQDSVVKNEETKQEVPKQEEATTSPQYPSLTDETMDKNLILSCAGGDTVNLWNKPTDAVGGAISRDKVPCGIIGFAFNKYENKVLGVTFYAINTNDKSVKTAYGWVTEDSITWR